MVRNTFGKWVIETSVTDGVGRGTIAIVKRSMPQRLDVGVVSSIPLSIVGAYLFMNLKLLIYSQQSIFYVSTFMKLGRGG